METGRGLFSVGPEPVLSTQLCLLEHDVSHYSCKSHEHNQFLVKAILDQMLSCGQCVGMLSDSKAAGRKKGWKHRSRLKGSKGGQLTTKLSFYSVLILCFSLIEQLSPFDFFEAASQCPCAAPSTVQCSGVLPKNGICDEEIPFSQPLLSGQNNTERLKENYL